MKSTYNERFRFDEPLSHTSASRATRFRAKKRKTALIGTPKEHQQISMETHNMTESGFVPGSSGYLQTHDEEIGLLNENPEEQIFNDSNDTEHHQCLEDMILLPPQLSHPGEYEDNDEVVEEQDDPSHSLSETQSNSTPLYEGSSFTVASSSVLIHKFKMRHNLTKQALVDLLKLIKLHCPSPNLCPSSVYLLDQQFPDFEYEVIMHYFCSKCLQTLLNALYV